MYKSTSEIAASDRTINTTTVLVRNLTMISSLRSLFRDSWKDSLSCGENKLHVKDFGLPASKSAGYCLTLRFFV